MVFHRKWNIRFVWVLSRTQQPNGMYVDIESDSTATSHTNTIFNSIANVPIFSTICVDYTICVDAKHHFFSVGYTICVGVKHHFLVRFVCVGYTICGAKWVLRRTQQSQIFHFAILRREIHTIFLCNLTRRNPFFWVLNSQQPQIFHFAILRWEIHTVFHCNFTKRNATQSTRYSMAILRREIPHGFPL